MDITYSDNKSGDDKSESEIKLVELSYGSLLEATDEEVCEYYGEEWVRVIGSPCKY